MLTAKVENVKSVHEFYTEIRKQQEAYHGDKYCAMHDAIRKYLVYCTSYKELGTHQGATASCAMTSEYKPKYMELVDIDHIKYRWKLKSLAEPFCKEHGIELVVKEADSASLGSVSDRSIDMLVIDSLHKRHHMEKELTMHASNVKKYIIAHDTTICQDQPADALFHCLYEFCREAPGWEVAEREMANVGYTVLKRK